LNKAADQTVLHIFQFSSDSFNLYFHSAKPSNSSINGTYTSINLWNNYRSKNWSCRHLSRA